MYQVFDQQRAILLDDPEVRPFHVQDYSPLAEALAQHKIHPQEQVLIAAIGDTVVVLPMLSMIYHHVAQGSVDDVPWMAAFCCLCNGGTVFSARYDNTHYTFAAQGYYDMMVLIADQQTQSYWNHLTGTCVEGPLRGAFLERLSPLTQMQAADALDAYPQAQLATADNMTEDEIITSESWNAIYHLAAEPALDDELLATGKALDQRVSRYDMGLGLWTARTQRYYSILQLYEQQGVIIDEVDGRSLVIILNETVGLPVAFYCETQDVRQQGKRVILSPTAFYENNTLYINGQPVRPERPNYAAIRWYGFSSIFPSCEIYGS